MNKVFVSTSLCAVGLLHLGCGSKGAGAADEETGTLQAALQGPDSTDPGLSPTHDVAAVRYVVVTQGEFCNSPNPVAVVTVPLQANPLPQSLLRDGGGSMHPFADALIMLPPSTYGVCAIPVNEGGGPSAPCEFDMRTVQIRSRETTETVFVSQCRTPDNGQLDAVTVLNNNPVINFMRIAPSKFITQCQTAELSVDVTDPDGDSLTFQWDVNGTVQSLRPVFTFRPPSVGDFLVRVVVRDGIFNGNFVPGVAVLSVTIHVSQCADAGAD